MLGWNHNLIERWKLMGIKKTLSFLDETESKDDERVEVAQKDVPSTVFGGLVRKRNKIEKDGVEDDVTAIKDKDGGSHPGAFERINLRNASQEADVGDCCS